MVIVIVVSLVTASTKIDLLDQTRFINTISYCLEGNFSLVQHLEEFQTQNSGIKQKTFSTQYNRLRITVNKSCAFS